MITRFFELIGGVIVATGLCLFALNRYSRFDDYLPENLSRIDLAIGVTLAGFVIVFASAVSKRSVSLKARKPAVSDAHDRTMRMRDEHEQIKQQAKALARQIRETPVAKGPPHTRCRLGVNVPQKPSNSWIGGQPHLPDDIEWPILNGVPAVFVAQIAVRDLPATTLGGAAPRDTSMVFFAHPETNETKVLLVSGPLSPRPPPMTEKLNVLWKHWQLLFTEHEKTLAPFVPDIRYKRPQWYLEVKVANDPGAYPNETYWNHSDDAVRAAKGLWRTGFDQTQEQYKPFDWPTARLCLDRIAKTWREAAMSAGTLEQYKTEADKAAWLALAERHNAQLSDLIKEIATLSETVIFDNVQRDALLTTLQVMPTSLNTSSPNYRIGLLNIAKGSARSEAYEALARRVYTRDPEMLPEAVRTGLEPVWAASAAHETIYVGDHVGPGFDAPTYTRLIDLPTSFLTGVHFGDMSRWIVTASLLDLAQGHADSAYGVDTHGQ